jgi:hypothetical protein
MADPLQVVALTAAGLALTEIYEAPLHLRKIDTKIVVII